MLTVTKTFPAAGFSWSVPAHCSASVTVTYCWSPTSTWTPTPGVGSGVLVGSGAAVGPVPAASDAGTLAASLGVGVVVVAELHAARTMRTATRVAAGAVDRPASGDRFMR